jgi:uncharacterized protein YecE (DUF72 family)
MKFGKLEDIDQVDFSMPCDMPQTRETLAKNRRSGDQVPFYMGGTGWSAKEWVGVIYPADAKAKDYLKYYSQSFNTIELNTTHYRIPTAEMVEKWRTESAADFRFCPKIPQTVSHATDLSVNTGLIEQFTNAVSGLGEKLGCCFIQLPPYFGVDKLAVLERFLQQFPSNIPLAVEARHESWFNNVQNANKLFTLLEKYNISSVITDVAGRRDVLHMRLTTNTAMVRFVGNGLHQTDYIRFNDWMRRFDNWYEQGLETMYFFLHQPDELAVIAIANYIAGLLQPFPRYLVKALQTNTANTVGQQFSLFME